MMNFSFLNFWSSVVCAIVVSFSCAYFLSLVLLIKKAACPAAWEK